MDLTIDIDDQAPPHMVIVTLGADGESLRVTLSRRLEAKVLVALNREIAEAVAAAIDGLP